VEPWALQRLPRTPNPVYLTTLNPPTNAAATFRGCGILFWRMNMDRKSEIQTGKKFELQQDARRFPVGQVVTTPGALRMSEVHNVPLCTLLARHMAGDWGSVCPEDAQSNESALKFGDRLLSSYVIAPDVAIWVITEADRSATTFLLPSEY
jgi:hypothetical protein